MSKYKEMTVMEAMGYHKSPKEEREQCLGEKIQAFNLTNLVKDRQYFTWIPNGLYGALLATPMGNERKIFDFLWLEVTKNQSLEVKVRYSNIATATGIDAKKIYPLIDKLQNMGIITSISGYAVKTITIQEDYRKWSLYRYSQNECWNLQEWLEKAKTGTMRGFITRPLELYPLLWGIKSDSARRIIDYFYYKTYGYKDITSPFVVRKSTIVRNTNILIANLSREMERVTDLDIFKVAFKRDEFDNLLNARHKFTISINPWIYLWKVPPEIKDSAYAFTRKARKALF